MTGYVGDIEKATEVNEYFREVVFTGKHLQLVVMNLKPGEEIGMEVHQEVDQFFRFEEGEGEVIIAGEKHQVKAGFAVVVPAGSLHNVINTAKNKELKLYTVYAPPNHPDGTIHATKAEAEAAEAEKHH
jgi:mannose-6-phosphate isomerase-like protein (cupin superfamily)